MKRFRCWLGLAAFFATPAFLVVAAGRFDQRLPQDKQVIHALNR